LVHLVLSHKPSRYFPAAEHHRRLSSTKLYTAWRQKQIYVKNLSGVTR